MSEPIQVQINIERLYLKDASFESPGSPAVFSEQFRPEMKVDINTRVNSLGDQRHEVVLSVTVSASRDEEKMAYIRVYLGSISGFMARVKESVARIFNLESKVTGSYWARRFGHRMLETLNQILGGNAYVDLNHVRAGAASSPFPTPTTWSGQNCKTPYPTPASRHAAFMFSTRGSPRSRASKVSSVRSA